MFCITQHFCNSNVLGMKTKPKQVTLREFIILGFETSGNCVICSRFVTSDANLSYAWVSWLEECFPSEDQGSFVMHDMPDVSYWEQMDAVPKK